MVTMVCMVLGIHWNVCGDVKNVVPPSPETCRPLGTVASVMFTTCSTVMLSVLLLLDALVSPQVHATKTLFVSGDAVLEATFTSSVTMDVPLFAAMAFAVV